MNMALPQLNLDALRSVPASQKVALLLLLVGGMIAGFYFYIAEPKSESIAALEAENTKLESEIQTLTIKVKHLDELVAANKQLEIELAKKKERLPPEEEAIMLLKQVSDLGVRLGLDIKLWRPGAQAEDPSKLFVKMPVSVEVAGVYHTAALFLTGSIDCPESSRCLGSRWGLLEWSRDDLFRKPPSISSPMQHHRRNQCPEQRNRCLLQK